MNHPPNVPLKNFHIKYSPKELLNYELHYAIKQGFVHKVKNLVAAGDNIYKYVLNGETPLYLALVYQHQEIIDILVDQYKHNFKILYDKFGSDRFWLQKNVIIAIGEQQSEKVMEVATRLKKTAENYENSVIIFLKPQEEIVVINACNCDEEVEVFDLIKSLEKNGRLSWNWSGRLGKCPQYLNVAAYLGMNEVIIKLVSLGAVLSAKGHNGHNTFMSACYNQQLETVKMLLENYREKIDILAYSDYYGYNCLHILMQNKNTNMIEIVIDAMIDARKSSFGETDAEAFNAVLKTNDQEYPNNFFFSRINKNYVNRTVQKLFVKYEFDVTQRYYFGEIALGQMLRLGICVDYCMSQILTNTDFLWQEDDQKNTAMHALELQEPTKFLEQIFEKYPETRTIFFKTSAGETAVSNLIWNKKFKEVNNVIRNHLDYCTSNPDFVRSVFKRMQHEQVFVDDLISNFPWLKEELDKPVKDIRKESEDIYNAIKDLEFLEMFQNMNLNDCVNDEGQTLIHRAMQDNKGELVLRLIEKGCDLHRLDAKGNHAIHFVKSVDMLNLILNECNEGSALIHKTNDAGMTVLHKCCSQKIELELLEKILELGADVDMRTNVDKQTAVFFSYNEKIFQTLLRNGADHNAVDAKGNSLLHHFLARRDYYMGPQLLSLDIFDYSILNNDGHSWLYYLLYSRDFFDTFYRHIFERHPETTDKMFRAICEKSMDHASKLFLKACMYSINYIVDKFMDYDINLNVVGEYQYTPILGLLSYTEEPNQPLVKRLLEKGVSLKHLCDHGNSALIATIRNWSTFSYYNEGISKVELLLKHGSEINHANYEGNTAFHYAVKTNDLNLIKCLLEANANHKIKNNDGLYPTDMGSQDTRILLNFLK